MPHFDRSAPTFSVDKQKRIAPSMVASPIDVSLFEGCADFPLGPVALTPEDVERFALEFDAQPMHLDPIAARNSPLGALSASGWHTCAITMELIVAALRAAGRSITVLGVEAVVWQRPARPGDRLRGSIKIDGRASCGCGEEVAKAIVQLGNQEDETIMRWRMDCVLATREARPLNGTLDCEMRQPRCTRIQRQSRFSGLKFFEDIEIGDELDLGSYALTSARCATFRRHTLVGDSSRPDEGRRDTVPLWLIPSAWMHCIVRYYDGQSASARKEHRNFPRLGPAAGVRHLRWRREVSIGEVLSFRAWAERKLEIGGRHDWGLLVAGAEALDAAGACVATFYPQLLLERRDSSNLA
ncbi:MAG: hypothetical protein EKK41_15450 [Hyphomicrobiales bacterium]|nr:MAG: hypothetical protein EKK41_15450 [Hyphomicrobiales bacterium]